MSDPRASVVLARFPDELSAVLLVGELQAAGIPAMVLGGLTAQLRAEAPGLVSVLVRQGDLARAEQLMAEMAPAEGWEDEIEKEFENEIEGEAEMEAELGDDLAEDADDRANPS